MRPTPDAGAIDYYRVPLSLINKNRAIFYIANKLSPVEENNMRVILHAMVNGAESGHVEMQPVSKESDGSYQFQVTMYPLNELVDIDNRINIISSASTYNWIFFFLKNFLNFFRCNFLIVANRKGLVFGRNNV
jgi:hypothetical protein